MAKANQLYITVRDQAFRKRPDLRDADWHGIAHRSSGNRPRAQAMIRG